MSGHAAVSNVMLMTAPTLLDRLATVYAGFETAWPIRLASWVAQ